MYQKNGLPGGLTPKQNFEDLASTNRRILNLILKNDRLVKLLYYNDTNVENKPNLTNQEKKNLIESQIKLVPRIPKDPEMKNYLIISLDNFNAVGDLNTFKSYSLSFDILCHADNWTMDDYMIRPFKIMAELDKTFNGSKIDTLGPVTFSSARQLLVSEELMGYSVYYDVENLI